jgi:paraquat-inducible protein B
MSGTEPPAAPAPPKAKLRRRRFSFVWVIPLVAAIIAGYLGYRTIIEQGPLLTLTFDTAEGLAAGQTQVKYKAVALGTVDSIDLSKDNSHVVVKVRMNNVGSRFLTSHARFWVVRPRFTPGDLSGLDTLVSGAFIAVDPGTPGGHEQQDFTGLEQPPGVRSNEPGHTYILKADSIGSLDTGSPVFYRDVQVGEVLGYDIGNGIGPVTLNIFVKAPFDNLVKPQSHFWNSSGITAKLQGGGFHIEFQSLQAIVSGGVTFDMPPGAQSNPPSDNNAVFHLFRSEDEADSAGYQTNIAIVSYFHSSVAGLVPGAPVNILGIQVGEVTDVKLIVDPNNGAVKVRVAMDLQPERVAGPGGVGDVDPEAVLRDMVNQGMRVELETASYVTGQKEISLAAVPGAGPIVLAQEGDALIVPSQPGGLDNTINNLSDITAKMNKIPFDKIGNNLNTLLITANKTIGGREMKQTLTSLSQTLNSANATLNSVNQDYGNDSDFQRSLSQLLVQANAALLSIKQLTDYLDRHPQSLLLGRGGQ